MIRSRVFVSLAVTLFLAGFASAEATVPAENSKEKAEADVKALEELTARVLGHAEAKLRLAENTNSDVKSQKDKAESAEEAVRTAAGTITATERKDEADDVAKKAKSEWTKCLQLHQTAKAKAEGVSGSLKQLVTSAKAMVEKAKIDIPDDPTPQTDYAKVIQDAAVVTADTTKVSKQINDSTLLSDTDAELVKLKDSAKKIEVFKYQAESIAIVSRIETALKTAETDIQSIPQKKVEIDAIVQAIKTKCKILSNTSKSSLSSLCSTANSQLRAATTKLQEAEQCNTDMKGQKTQIDATLVTLKDVTEEEKAKQEAAKVKQNKGFIDGKLQKITAALGEVKNALSSAKGVQQQIQDALDKTSKQPVDAHLDTTEQTKSTQLTDNQTPNPKDDKSELLNKDKLRNITKDITNNPLTGGEVPTRSAANDSAVTVFIPLLVILVISAVLH